MGDLDTACGQEAQQLLDKTVKFTEKLYDMSDEEIHEYIDAQGKDCNKILYIEFQYYQIGETDAWLQEMSAKIGDPLVVRREILLQRLHGSSLSPYPQEDLEYIAESEQKPIDELWIMEYYKFDIYEQLNPKIPYIVGVDCSTGTNGDNNAITIINPYTVEPVAEFECSYIGETKYEQLLIELVTKHIPRAVLCIERNSVGDGIIDHLLNSTISNRLYFDKNKDLVEETNRSHESIESMLKKSASRKSFYGVYTGTNSRDDMFAILARHVNEYKEKFKTRNIIRDLSALVRTKSGRIEAGPGFHDDSIMSYLIALYVYYHGNNLPVFGIIKGEQNLPNNKGLKRADEIDATLVDRTLIESVKQQEQLISKQQEWERMMKEASINAQKETYKLYKAGEIKNTVFDNTPDVVMDQYENEGSIDLDFFNTLNNF